MIGRGAIANPWIFQQAKHYLKTGELLSPPSIREKIDLCISHLKLSVEYSHFREAVTPFRKFYSGYLKGIPNVVKLRGDLMQLVEFNKVVDRLNEFADQNSGRLEACSC